MENKEKIELNTEQIELIDLISNIRKERCSHLNVYKFAEWEHYFQKLEYVSTISVADSDFYTQIAITSDGKTNYYKRYLSATDIVDMTECVKKINSLSSDSGEHGESLKRQSILCNKGINITFNIIDHPIENDGQIYKNVDVTGIDIPELNDYDTWHFVGDRLPKNASFMCIVKMFNEFSDTWTTGTGVYDHGKWEATDSSGESWPVRYWRRCPDFEAEGHYVGLKEDIAKIYAKNKAFNNLTEIQIGELKQWDGKTSLSLEPNGGVSSMTFKAKEKQSYGATEFQCAMQKLDDLEVPRVDDKNKEFSIVGRIMWLAKLCGLAINDIESETLNRTEDVVTRTLDFNLGDLVVLKSDATKVMTVSDVNSSYAVECMFWSNDQMVQMSFPVYTIEKI